MSKTPRHPIQPFVVVRGVLRFKKNPIVDYLLNRHQGSFTLGGGGLNDLMIRSKEEGFEKADFCQLAQLIGYSVVGILDTGFADSDTAHKIDVFSRDYPTMNPALDVPAEIHEAALLLTQYFETIGVRSWALHGVKSRFDDARRSS